MTIPGKRKASSATKRQRSHRALLNLKLIKCPKCGKPSRPHRVCPFCGFYQGREIVKLKTKKKKETKK